MLCRKLSISGKGRILKILIKSVFLLSQREAMQTEMSEFFTNELILKKGILAVSLVFVSLCLSCTLHK